MCYYKSTGIGTFQLDTFKVLAHFEDEVLNFGMLAGKSSRLHKLDIFWNQRRLIIINVRTQISTSFTKWNTRLHRLILYIYVLNTNSTQITTVCCSQTTYGFIRIMQYTTSIWLLLYLLFLLSNLQSTFTQLHSMFF